MKEAESMPVTLHTEFNEEVKLIFPEFHGQRPGRSPSQIAEQRKGSLEMGPMVWLEQFEQNC